MKKRPDLQAECITSGEIADLIGVSRPAVSNYKKRHPEFPDPAFVDSTGRVRLYWRSDIEDWIVKHYGGAGNVEDAALNLERQAEAMRERADKLRRMSAR